MMSLIELRRKRLQQATLQRDKECVYRTRNYNNPRYDRTEAYAECR